MRNAGMSSYGHCLKTANLIARRLFSNTSQSTSSASSSRWLARNRKDAYVKESSTKGLMSRAAWKLIEMDEKYKLFKKGQTVVDLGYAPGSWTQVAQERTKPSGLIVGVDLIPAMPPRGVSTIQGNFLDPAVQDLLKRRIRQLKASKVAPAPAAPEPAGKMEQSDVVVTTKPSYIDMGKVALEEASLPSPDGSEQRLIDVVLSDMSEPWGQMSSSKSNTLSNPYHRLMNTSGSKLRDHSGSMDLCNAALQFAMDTLKTGGNFVCKFYQGSEDKALEESLKQLFKYVHREKPNSSRKESRESFFVAINKRAVPKAASSGRGGSAKTKGEDMSSTEP